MVNRLVEMGPPRRRPLHYRAARSTFVPIQDEVGPPTFFRSEPRSRWRALAGLASLILILILGLIGVVKATFLGAGVTQSQVNLFINTSPVANGVVGSASIAGRLAHAAKLTPARPGETAAALAGGADGRALQPHEVFGFAPYWTLDQSGGFDLTA